MIEESVVKPDPEFVQAMGESFIKKGYLEEYGIDNKQLEQLISYGYKLVEANKVMNLTGITEPEDIVIKHFVDSLTLLPYLDRAYKKVPRDHAVDEDAESGSDIPRFTLADVGTGAGFPGLPLKIMRPHIGLVLIDSLKKWVNFLSEVVQMLNLEGVRCLHIRAEEAGRQATLRDQMDAATARAVAPLDVLAEYCLPLVKRGGYFWAMKGVLDEEIKEAKSAIKRLGGQLERTDEFFLPQTDIKRTVVSVRKIKTTPEAFPRANGVPKKRPLK